MRSVIGGMFFDGAVRGYTYRWDEEGRDALPVEPSGHETVLGKQNWRFPSRAECMSCHSQRSNFPLRLKTAQLDRGGPGGKNQFDALISKRLLADDGALRAGKGKPLTEPLDSTHDLGDRARSYLDLNCAHRHRETSLSGRANFQLLASLPLAETGIIDAHPIVGVLGTADTRIVAPGRHDDSELLARMKQRGPTGMPLLGSQVVDAAGVALIKEWIESMAR